MSRVLVIDDDASLRFTLEAVLSDAGLVVEACDGGASGLAAFEAHGADVVLTDLAMPEMDGMQVLERMRASDPSVPVLMLTAHGSERVAVSAMKAGAFDYIPKPFDPDELYARIQTGVRILTLQQSLADRVRDLEVALTNVKQLQGLLPMCSYCKCIRNDQNYWMQLEHYLTAHSDAQFSHGICPGCFAGIVEPQLQALRKGTGQPAGV